MNKRRIITLSLVLLAIVMVVYALYFEEHTVALFDGNTREQHAGDDYVKVIESGQLLRSEDGKLYDAKSLTPDAARLDDCPT